MNARRSHLPRSLWLGIALVFFLITVPAFASAKKGDGGNPHGDPPGKAEKTPEPDWCTGGGDDSCSDGNPSDTDKNNKDDQHSNGPNRPAPNENAAAHANCDNNGFDFDQVRVKKVPPPVVATRTPPPPKASPTPQPSLTPTPGVQIPEEERVRPTSQEALGFCKLEVYGQDEYSDVGREIVVRTVKRPDGYPVMSDPITVTQVITGSQVNPAFDMSGLTCVDMAYENHASGDPVLEIARYDGSNAHQLLVDNKPLNAIQPFWGRGGQIVAVLDDNLFSVMPDGSGFTYLGVSCSQPAVDPTGKWVACNEEGKLVLIDIRGAFYGKFTPTDMENQPYACQAPRWDPEAIAVLCGEYEIGLSYILGNTKLPLHPQADSTVLDPLGSTWAIAFDKQGSTLVEDLLHLDKNVTLASQGEVLGGDGHNGTWWAWNMLQPTTNPFITQYQNIPGPNSR